MNKTTAILIALMLASPAAFAATETKHAAQAPIEQGEVVHVGVNGMVCDFCAQSLKKEFMKDGKVAQVDISLEKKLVTLHMKKGQTLDDAAIKKHIDWAGYQVSGIHRVKGE